MKISTVFHRVNKDALTSLEDGSYQFHIKLFSIKECCASREKDESKSSCVVCGVCVNVCKRKCVCERGERDTVDVYLWVRRKETGRKKRRRLSVYLKPMGFLKEQKLWDWTKRSSSKMKNPLAKRQAKPLVLWRSFDWKSNVNIILIWCGLFCCGCVYRGRESSETINPICIESLPVLTSHQFGWIPDNCATCSGTEAALAFHYLCAIHQLLPPGLERVN